MHLSRNLIKFDHAFCLLGSKKVRNGLQAGVRSLANQMIDFLLFDMTIVLYSEQVCNAKVQH